MIKLDVLLNRLLSKFKVFSKKLFYIGGNDALPPPLTKDEEDELSGID